MIVQPDFLDHWKTQYLSELLDDPCAPIYVIRLWGHCQNRKTHRFSRVNPSITKAICKAPHEADFFEKAMVEAGFLRLEDGDIIAHDWEVINASLIANWENGKKGGRPRKKPMGSKRVNPSITHPKPIREEKIDKIEKSSGVKDKFSPPTQEMVLKYVKDYTKEKRLAVDLMYCGMTAEKIVNHYENCSWKLSGGRGAKMKDWKRAVGNWIMGDVEKKIISR